MSGSLPQTKDLVNGAFTLVKEYTKLTADLAEEDYDYHMAFPAFRHQITRHSEAVVSLMDKFCQLLPAKRRVTLSSTGGKLTDPQRAAVMEAADSLLENVDGLLDELKGRRLSAKDQLSVKFGSELQGVVPSSSYSVFNAAGVSVLRPQLTFEHPVDNSPTPFRPVYYDEKGVRHVGEPGVHPFAERIKAVSVPSEQLLLKTETPYLSLVTCPLTFVDTVEDLEAVVAVLLNETEIAVDLEHHDFYSYQGFTCLMQISTRTQDFIVDCLKVRANMYLMAPVFLQPNIVKVFHGAREDVRWLQKDFGLYIVNLFDTSIALQNLHMPHSLAFAVDHFCQVKLNKKYQTADWRVRPIPAEMVSYAQQDTHFLLYVYDRLKQLLLNCEARASVGNMLLHVFQESRLLSLERYEKPHLDPDVTYKQALGRSLGGLSSSQLQVAREIFNWRDMAAREADDSPSAVMHISCVLSIATKLPTSANEVLKCCSPVSVAVRTNVMKLLQIVKDAIGSADSLKDGANGDVKPKPLPNVGVALRYMGVHRSMTGTLPSIEQRADTAFTVEDTHVVVRTEPSAWFETMRNVAAILRRKPYYPIALPGHDVVTRMSAVKRAREVEEMKVKGEGEGEEEEKRVHIDAEEPTVERENSSERGEGMAGPCLQEGLEVKDEVEEIDVPTQKPLELKEGAISLRQQYGTGSANRKKARLGKKNKS